MLYFMFQQNSSDTTAMFHSQQGHTDVNIRIMHYTQVKNAGFDAEVSQDHQYVTVYLW